MTTRGGEPGDDAGPAEARRQDLVRVLRRTIEMISLAELFELHGLVSRLESVRREAERMLRIEGGGRT